MIYSQQRISTPKLKQKGEAKALPFLHLKEDFLYMANTKNTWINLPDKTTPIDADRLNNLENNAFKGAEFADVPTSIGLQVLVASSEAIARGAIGAGTSNLAVGSVVPSAAGTAAAGSATTAARSDHVHPLQTTITGNAATATALATGRTFALTGGATGTSAAFTGAANATIAVTLATPASGVKGGIAQGAAIADATDAATTQTQLNAVLAYLRAQGAIAT